MINWIIVNNKATTFYKHYCFKYRKPSLTIAEEAASLSYRASMNMRDPSHIIWATQPSGLSQTLKKKFCPIIANFLDTNDFSTSKCLELIAKIRELYHNEGVSAYTYGNSQKWITMAIKYYVVLNSYDMKSGTCDVYGFFTCKLTTPPYFNCHIFPVDTSFSNKINGLIGIDFKSKYSRGLSWHKCDDKEAFLKYWADVEAKLKLTHDIPTFIYEIEHF